uniref:Uncharacterized protein n=1 Tax=Cacopsylla melanoneura TaxID=428564 RepID=A0A8D8ZA30_9HEMI
MSNALEKSIGTNHTLMMWIIKVIFKAKSIQMMITSPVICDMIMVSTLNHSYSIHISMFYSWIEKQAVWRNKRQFFVCDRLRVRNNPGLTEGGISMPTLFQA